MVKTFRLTSLEEALCVATTLTRSWFRGHSTVVGKLEPRLFRPEHWDRWLAVFRPDLELAIIESFKRQAGLFVDGRLPSADDNLGWLCLMQHHRIPTRLLDWSENLLVALYFSVAEHGHEDGEIWAMLPWMLNQEAGAGFGIPLANSLFLRFFLDQPYWEGTPETLSRAIGLQSPVSTPLAIQPPLRFPRMAAQASTFTIHPVPNYDARDITDALSDQRHLVRYLIPAGAKPQLLKGLRALGVTQRHLFPDLDGLAGALALETHVLGYAPPNPPPCSGEVSPPS